tara:strand:- start:37 stop:180 length:144 start_codon:yes stop_codon:yes gene_type:complete
MNSNEILFWKRVDNLKAYLKKVEKTLPDMHAMFKMKLILLMQNVKEL